MTKPYHRAPDGSLTTFDPMDLPAIPDWLGFWASTSAAATKVAPAAQISATAPTVVQTATTPTSTLYLQEAGTASLISVSDINQGQIGDCFLLSSIGEIALWHPSAIMNMITLNADGTETVTLHLAASGQLPTFGTTSFTTTFVTVTNSFPNYAVNNGASQDVYNGQKEIWVQVLEKAVATLDGGYGAIANGGNPMIAMEELVGQATTWMSPSMLTLSALQSYMSAGDLIVMDTKSSNSLPYGLYGSHAYMFEALTMLGGTPMVQLGNPWGFDQPSLIPLSQLSSGIAEIDVGQFVDSNVITGTSGNDTKKLTSPVTNAYIDLGAGNDTLILANGTNSATVANTEIIIGGTGNDTIILATAANGSSIDLGAGNDTLTFGNFTNTATVANVETIIGGTGNDSITLATALTPTSRVDLGLGSNTLMLAAGGNTGTVFDVNTLIGGSGADSITLGTPLIKGSVDLGGGNDSLTLANGGNSATISNVETIIGGSANDAITLGAPAVNASIDLGAGSDTLILGNFNNVVSVANAETITGGSGNDTVTLLTPLTPGMSVDLGAGTNKLTLANGGNTGTVRNVSTLIGGSGADSMVLGTAITNGSIDLGGGNDTLTLANGTNSVTVANTEIVRGGSGSDTILLTGSVASTVIGGGGMNYITGNTAADQFVFDQDSAGNFTKVMNFSTSYGDKIALDTKGSSIFAGNAYDLGGAALALNSDLADVTNVSALRATKLANGGKGGFAYEQDNGQLYYSSNGSFTGGGTLIGVITTDGVHPWAFNASSFIQV